MSVGALFKRFSAYFAGLGLEFPTCARFSSDRVARYSSYPVSYTHLDVYKRQAATASSGTASTALPVRFHADDSYLSQAGAGDFCFVETDDVLPLESQAEAMILYRWNRHYPSDLTFRIPLTGHGWRLTAVTEFPGFSHERITEEVYKK